MEYKNIATIPVVCNNSDDINILLESLKGKYIFMNTKTKDKKNLMHLTSTFKITDVIVGKKDEIGIVGDNNFINLPIERVIELAQYGMVSVTEHEHDDTYISNYYIVA